jgi:hypothetical protein
MKNNQNGETLAVFCMAVLAPFFAFAALPILLFVLFIISVEHTFSKK